MKTLDTDFLYISSRIKGLQKNMLGHDGLLRLATAKSNDDAVKILQDCGFSDFDPLDPLSLEHQMDIKRRELFTLLYTYCPNKSIIDVFRLKYDYHNLKSILKAKEMGTDPTKLLSDAAIIEPSKIALIMREKLFHELSPTMRDAVIEASELLSRTCDPQLSDIVLDKACYKEMVQYAKESESQFLKGYVSLSIDLANLRIAVRAKRAEKGFDYLKRAVVEGGTISTERLIGEPTPDWITTTFATAGLSNSANIAAACLTGEKPMAEMDKACDNALVGYLKSAKLVAFGEAHVIAYLVAFEAQLVAIRTVMMGRKARLSEEKIIERLRESYV